MTFTLRLFVCALWLSASLTRPLAADEDAAERARRLEAAKLFKDGNFAEAYTRYSALALDAGRGPDLKMALSCLQSLGRQDENDAFREDVIARHADDWRLLADAAESCAQDQHWGFIVAGAFQRGGHRGGGRQANAVERDRIRALQLMQAALNKAEREEKYQREVGDLCWRFARVLLNGREGDQSWRLQALSDCTQLPDYDDKGAVYGTARHAGAPVGADGNPVFYSVPASFAAAANDGERWRWLLQRAAILDPTLKATILWSWAGFLRQQFGTETLAEYRFYFDQVGDDLEEGMKSSSDASSSSLQPSSLQPSGTYALHTLKDNETIARLAAGIRRFTLSADYDFIAFYKQLAATPEGGYAQMALEQLAQIYENRRQFETAADYWRQNIARFGPGDKNYKKDRLHQIVGNWGEFEPIMAQPAGSGATVDFRFRNGKQVRFEAHAIDVKQLLDDVRSYLQSTPDEKHWDGNKLNVEDIGYRLVRDGEKKYIGRRVASWDLALEPRPHHFDRRLTVATPLTNAGAYLLTAVMADGNTSKIVMWLNDTVLVSKPMPDKKTFLYVADAVSGRPITNATITAFGYRMDYAPRPPLNKPRYRILTAQFEARTDADGQAMPSGQESHENYNWLIAATNASGRLAYMGFYGLWYGRYYDPDYNAAKALVITDRPVYRPNQPVKFKFWVRHAQYDMEKDTAYAGQSFTVRVDNPRSEKVFEQTYKADEYGGFDGVLTLPKDVVLGVYRIYLVGRPESARGGNFRVEEYKKPEFEVKIEAPMEPIALGDSLTATVKAHYYFGAPVTKAGVKYKVLRHTHDTVWYPVGIWDWFYGRGYWWFACDYPWYPGWHEWGCKRPRFCWYPPFSAAPPEVVAEGEAPLSADGTLKITIDTAPAKAIHGDRDHRYEITAEVTDESRRTIVSAGSVLAARKPFKVYAWVDRGHYRVGDTVRAEFLAQTPDNKPVRGQGNLTLFKITYDTNAAPVETATHTAALDPDTEGRAQLQLKAAEAGQYRLSYRVTDTTNHTIEGGYVFTVRGDASLAGDSAKDYRFNAIELVPDKREYAPGDNVRLQINTEQPNATVLLFVRPVNGLYLPPKTLRLTGKSTLEEIEISKKDMPNCFVEAVTIANGKVHSETRELVVPPEQRVLNVAVRPSADTYKPGAPAKARVTLTDLAGRPFVGSLVVAVYDKALEYISGGSNVPEIREFFWKWRRNHSPRTMTNAERGSDNVAEGKAMQSIGLFGETVADEIGDKQEMSDRLSSPSRRHRMERFAGKVAMASGVAMSDASFALAAEAGEEAGGIGDGDEPSAAAQPIVRTQFADSAFWAAALSTDTNGEAEVSFNMPENLTGWKFKAWAMGHGTQVGQGEAEAATAKNVMLRLQAPRFFVEKDEVVLSANIHNFLKTDKAVEARLELDGPALHFMSGPTQTVRIAAGGEQRVDWRVKALREGEAVVRMKALTDEESDAMEMRFPVYVHGMLKMESFSGALRPEQTEGRLTLTVPKERRPEASRLEIRYSPTLAGALVDALPYLADYPYGCTEQTLNRFLPTVLTQNILKKMGLDLKAIRDKRTNLNAQEIGDDRERARGWQRFDRHPVFEEDTLADMVRHGVEALASMQVSDGGWGWFSGWGERSWPHTTATVVHGLQLARESGVTLPPNMVERGVAWLKDYQSEQVRLLNRAESKKEPFKIRADDQDAFVYMVLADAGVREAAMRDYLYRDRLELSVYAKAMFGLALHKQDETDKLAMVLRNIEQYLVRDEENQTAYLKLPNTAYWWCWYGSEIESHAYYLKLLARTEPKGDKAPGLVKYLLNNRKHATYWNSTRDTALCIEAMADYLKASGEDRPDLTVTVLLDGQAKQETRITAENLFVFDNKLVLEGAALTAGKHTLELRKQGRGPLYYNAYQTDFTLEDPIRRAGLEIKVRRAVYRLVREERKILAEGAHGQAVGQQVEHYRREPLADGAQVKSGDLLEVELTIESKNDYEYLVFEDLKAAGCEPVDVRSGYTANDLNAYVEFRDERVCFFARALARGTHSVAYRLRAEIPGAFSALPTRAYAMYAPELKANSDEFKLRIEE